MPSSRPAVSFRLTDGTREALARQSVRYGVSQAALIEVLVRMLDQGHLSVVIPDGVRPCRPRKPGGDSAPA